MTNLIAAALLSSTAGAMTPDGLEVATFGGGCFWCLEAVYQEVDGVERVISGYSGGHQDDPSYREVCTGATGHAEVVQVYFDPQRVRYADLLAVFWTVHDPTSLNRQGADRGTQYRSAVFFHSPEQEQTARASMVEAQARYERPIVTEITAFERFWPAEAYHQDYFARHPDQAYCRAVVAPKVHKFQKAHADLLTTE